LDRETLGDLLNPYDIRLLEITADPIDVRTLVSLLPTATVSATAGKMKGRVSKWLSEQVRPAQPTKSLGRGYFAATTGQSTTNAVEAYLEQQGEHHGYSGRARPPVLVRRFERTSEAEQILQTDHARTRLRFHVVLATWRRRGVFVQSSAEMICDGWRLLQSELQMVVEKVSFVPDHVHVAIALHPNASPAGTLIPMMNAAQQLMWERFDATVVKAGVERLWQPSAYIGSFGDLTSNAISAYVRQWEREG